jgi:deoxycytidylate deaminase
MTDTLMRVEFPELIIGIAGPIGVDVDAISDCVNSALKNVGYLTVPIKLTDEMKVITAEITIPKKSDFYNDTKYKMDYANRLCNKLKERSTMASIAIRAIHEKRRGINESSVLNPEIDAALEKTAFLVRQLKRPQEVELFRKVYGRQFILISAYGAVEHRERIIQSRLRRTLPTNTPSSEIACKVEYLIARDASEDADFYGQHLRDTFHLADVFVDGINKQEMAVKIERFICALFGKTDIAPSKEEYGMYAATSAALRSSDLSRQVGAAIVTTEGEIITQGCNEVPKALGGTYWDLEEPDHRDVRLGSDPNEIAKKELLRDLLERLSKNDMLSEKALLLGNATAMVDALSRRAVPGDPTDKDGPLVGSEVLDLTEYGRVVHAEMCAICDAARIGRSVKGAILYCTTFPCHNCTKHIIAVGIKKVVYMEPYPKSRAKQLHENEISIEVDTPNAVSFMPFLGISPFRYRDIFQKGRRKKIDGSAKNWYSDSPRPLLDIVSNSYILVEPLAYANLFGHMTVAKSSAQTPPEAGSA